jgi:lyso-ornithine lipid O-acyltransferase
MRHWQGPPPPPMPRIGLRGGLRVLCRGLPLAVLVFGCLALLVLVRLVERPLFGLRRPVTPRITVFVCRTAFRLMGMGHAVRGRPMDRHGAIVANHASWLDIFALNACDRVYFVSKAEVAGWPGIGWLARATGTVFIARDPKQAPAQKRLFEARLDAGHRLLFFPEGTSTDGRRVLPFKTTLFAAFFAPHLADTCAIQPATLIYHAPSGADPGFHGWWGDMGFGGHMLKVLAARDPGSVEVVFHDPVPVMAHRSRKTLAAVAEARVRATLVAALGPEPRDGHSASGQDEAAAPPLRAG